MCASVQQTSKGYFGPWHCTSHLSILVLKNISISGYFSLTCCTNCMECGPSLAPWHEINVYFLMGEKAIWLDITCLSVRPYFHEPQAGENTADKSAISHSHTSNNRFIIYYSDLAAPRKQTATVHAQYKGRVRAYLMSFRLLPCFQLWLGIDPSTSGRKYRMLVNNATFIHNESLFVVSAAAMCAFQFFFSKHQSLIIKQKKKVSLSSGFEAHAVVATQHVPCRLSNTDHQKYGKIVMLFYGKYYWHIYQVYNKFGTVCSTPCKFQHVPSNARCDSLLKIHKKFCAHEIFHQNLRWQFSLQVIVTCCYEPDHILSTAVL